jgi:DNA-directed RNA polymerase sigma subunit (sigma70/sigma32)
MSRLKEINDEIYARWKAGENYIDLAAEYGRDYIAGVETMLKRRAHAEAHANDPPRETRSEYLKRIHATERDADIIACRDAGSATYQALGEKYGICRERVRQIWMRELRRRNDPRGKYGMRFAAKLAELAKLREG